MRNRIYSTNFTIKSGMTTGTYPRTSEVSKQGEGSKAWKRERGNQIKNVTARKKTSPQMVVLYAKKSSEQNGIIP